MGPPCLGLSRRPPWIGLRRGFLVGIGTHRGRFFRSAAPSKELLERCLVALNRDLFSSIVDRHGRSLASRPFARRSSPLRRGRGSRIIAATSARICGLAYFFCSKARHQYKGCLGELSPTTIKLLGCSKTFFPRPLYSRWRIRSAAPSRWHARCQSSACFFGGHSVGRERINLTRAFLRSASFAAVCDRRPDSRRGRGLRARTPTAGRTPFS